MSCEHPVAFCGSPVVCCLLSHLCVRYLLDNITMRDNYEICIIGEKCVLVPYRPEHVLTYHEWMKDPDLLEATGSEPLSLEEEIAMQQSWREDAHKCTFIVLAKHMCSLLEEKTATTVDSSFVERNLNAMVGDVNLFLSLEEEVEEDESDQNDAAPSHMLQAELDIMIADRAHRGQGLGREASCLMMLYGANALGVRRYYCKINEDNHKSRGLFENLGFRQCNYAECFRQVELELRRDGAEAMTEAVSSLLGGKKELKITQCPLKNGIKA